ncbi:MAG: hypothetical protein ACLUEK_13795 [Oscillospiraceae bacterium]
MDMVMAGHITATAGTMNRNDIMRSLPARCVRSWADGVVVTDS